MRHWGWLMSRIMVEAKNPTMVVSHFRDRPTFTGSHHLDGDQRMRHLIEIDGLRIALTTAQAVELGQQIADELMFEMEVRRV